MHTEPPPPSTRFTTLAWAPLVALLGFFAVALWEYDPAAFVGDAPIVRLSQSPVCRGETGVKATQTFPSFLAANASHSSRIPSRRREAPIFLTAVAVCQESASVLSWVEKLCHRPDPRRGEWRVTIYHQCDENNFGTLPSLNLRRSGHLGTAHALAELDRASASSSSSSSSGSGSGARWASFNRFNRTWPSGPCIQHMWNRSVGTGREQEAYLSHILRYYHSLEVSRDHKRNRRRLQLEKQQQVQKKRWSEQQQQRKGEKEAKKQMLNQVERKHEQKHEQRRQLGRAKGWRLGQSASSSSRGNHGRQQPQQARRTYLVFLQADADSEFKLPPFVGDPAAALEAMAAADDDDDDGGGGDDDGRGNGNAGRREGGSSSSRATRGNRATSTSSSSGSGRSHDGFQAAGLLGFASLTGTAFRTPPPQSFRKRVAATWLNPVDNRAPRARYLCRWSPVDLAMQARSGQVPVVSSSTTITTAAASAAVAAVPPLSAAASAASAAPRSRPPLSHHRASEEVDCRRAYLTPSRAQFVVSPLRVRALPFETWEALHALSVTSTGVATDPFEHSWAALFGCLLPADCPKAERRLSKRHASPIGLECHD